MTTAITQPQPSVTLITALADATDMSDAEYRAIYERVAIGRSLRNVALALRSAVTFGWWAMYANGEKQLDRARKNELRAWDGLPELPPTVAEAVTGVTHPDAAVYRVGVEIASRVVLVGADVPLVDLRLNGSLSVLPDAARNADVTGVTGIASDDSPRMIGQCIDDAKRRKPAPPCIRPRLSIDPVERIAQCERIIDEARRQCA